MSVSVSQYLFLALVRIVPQTFGISPPQELRYSLKNYISNAGFGSLSLSFKDSMNLISYCLENWDLWREEEPCDMSRHVDKILKC